MHPTNQATVLMLLFMLSGMLAFLRWSRGGRLFIAFQVVTGIPWIAYGIDAYNQGRANYIGMVTMAGWWTVVRSPIIDSDDQAAARSYRWCNPHHFGI